MFNIKTTNGGEGLTVADEAKHGVFMRILIFILQVICWLIAVCGLLLTAYAFYSGEYMGGALMLAGSITIMPAMNRLSIFRGKLTGHLRRLAAVVLLIVGMSIAFTSAPDIGIKDNALDISREQLTQMITERLKEMGQPVGEISEEGQTIGEFVQAEVNEAGRYSSYQIYEARISEDVSVQIIQHSGKIAAVRACAAADDYYTEPDQSTEQIINSVMDWLLDKCGVLSNDKQAIISQLKANDNTGRVTKYNYIVEMKSEPYYRETVMIYDTQSADQLDQVNTAEIDNKLSVYDYLSGPEQSVSEQPLESW